MADTDCVVYVAGTEVVRRITGMAVHRGSMGIFLRPPPRDPEEVIARARRLALLEAVVNPVNLGLIARSAAAFGVDGVLLDDATVDPFYRRASRVSMGEVFALPFATVGRCVPTIERLDGLGIVTVALTPSDDAVDLAGLDLANRERVAMVLGSEGPGLRRETADACAHRARIPISSRVDSLNVGVAAGIAFHELTRGSPPG